MTNAKRLLCLVMAVVTVLGILVIPASAKAKAPISLCVMTDRTDCGYLGVVTVTITLKNISNKDIKNVVITSSESEGLVTYRPVLKNVLITNPCATPLRKKDSITTCLKPGGMMKYTYCVLLGYQYSFRKIPESTSILMAKQHKMLDTKKFKDVSIKSGGYVTTRVPIAFCDVPATLLVKAYYNTADDAYDALAAGEEVVEARGSSETRTTSSSSGRLPSPTANSGSDGSASRTGNNSTDKPSFDKTESTTFIINTKSEVLHRTDWDCGHRPTVNRDTVEGTYNELAKPRGLYTPCEYCFD